jgi:hypothetical protein
MSDFEVAIPNVHIYTSLENFHSYYYIINHGYF